MGFDSLIFTSESPANTFSGFWKKRLFVTSGLFVSSGLQMMFSSVGAYALITLQVMFLSWFSLWWLNKAFSDISSKLTFRLFIRKKCLKTWNSGLSIKLSIDLAGRPAGYVSKLVYHLKMEIHVPHYFYYEFLEPSLLLIKIWKSHRWY